MNIPLQRFILCSAAALVFAPLLPGIINKVKAFFAGRKGQKITQQYYDLFKLLKKESVISSTSGGIIRLAPAILLVFTAAALLLLPSGFCDSPWSFSGDALIFFYLLGTVRLFSVFAALDTGSSFEGMGSSREVFFSALAEAGIFAVLAYLSLASGSLTLSGMLMGNGVDSWWHFTPVMLTYLALFLIMLAENCRVPFDDPETHLELTMIHEAMILDYAGFDLAAVLYASSLKLWIFSAMMTTLLLPAGIFSPVMEIILYFSGIILNAVLIGIVESSMARYRFLKVPPLLIAAVIMPVLAILFYFFFDGGVQ